MGNMHVCVVVLIALLASSRVSSSFSASSIIIPTELKCESRRDPVGVGALPKFSWLLSLPSNALSPKHRNKEQQAYQVVVYTLDSYTGDIITYWDSEKVLSNSSHHIVYAGKPLVSHTRYFWKVQIWDEEGVQSEWSDAVSFSTAIVKDADWRAKWILYPKATPTAGDIMRKEFNISSQKKIWRALVSVVGLGLYELRLNGEKVGDDVISNAWTKYDKKVFYATYDITDSLTNGYNCFGVLLGNGMYNVVAGERYAKFEGSFGPRKLFLQLTTQYTDGTIDYVISDETWMSTSGPITFNSIYGGEDYNATLEEPGWDNKGFVYSPNWIPAKNTTAPKGYLAAQNSPSVKIQKVLTTVSVTQPLPGIFVYDLGQNFAGWPEITVKGSRGSFLLIYVGELLQDDGTINQDQSGGPYYFIYTLSGNRGRSEQWHPRFSYYGFRWVQIESVGDVEIISIKGHLMHNSAELVGSFFSSNILFNKIHEIILTSFRSNFQNIFHDCPHREKLGWLEETHLLAKSFAYNYDVAQFYPKIVEDMLESQNDNGVIPSICPQYVVFPNELFVNSPEWGSAYIINPLFLFDFYGDMGTLEKHYTNMAKYISYLSSTSHNSLLYNGLGDWLDIVLYPEIDDSSSPKNTPVNITVSSIYYQDLMAMENAAKILQKPVDYAKFSQMAASTKTAFNFYFLNQPANDSYATGSQTANSMAVALGLIPTAYITRVVNNIVADVREQNNHTTSGDIGHVYLLRALANNNRSDVIFDIATRDDLAGYAYMLSVGATSLPEVWDASYDSQNHAMFGHIEEWFYEHLAGIQFSHKHIVIKPNIVGDVSFVNATFNSIYGLVSSMWKRDIENNNLALHVNIPVNTHATIFVPSKNHNLVLESGMRFDYVENLKILGKSEKYVSVYVGSGLYQFESVY